MTNKELERRKTELIISGELLRYDLKLQILQARQNMQFGFDIFRLVKQTFFSRKERG